MKKCCIVLLVVSIAACVHVPVEKGAGGEVKEELVIETAIEYSRMFYSSAMDELYGHFSGQMKDLVALETLQTIGDSISEELGREVEVQNESSLMFNGILLYTRISRFEKAGTPLVLFWGIDPDGTITGFQVTEVTDPPSPYSQYQNASAHHVPFSGTWLVFWGGRLLHQNYHVTYGPQRFACDFLILKDGFSFEGDGRKNEDYYCFGREIKASLEGVVAAAEDGVPDNRPGVMNSARPFGNYVVIDHRNGEYSVYAHLKKGTVAVSAGQRVNTGDILGLCGNSGNSSEAHLHFHVQDSPDLEAGAGMPVAFHDCFINGVETEKAEPVRGDYLGDIADSEL